MGGFFGVAAKTDCILDLFYGVDYHSHLGTRRGGMATFGKGGFHRAIHNIENSPFRTKFERDVEEMKGNIGIGCISDFEPQPLLIQSHLGSFAITTVGKINNLAHPCERVIVKNDYFFIFCQMDVKFDADMLPDCFLKSFHGIFRNGTGI